MSKKRFVTLLALGALASLALSGCGLPKDLYSWYDYEELAFNWAKKQTPESEAELMNEYVKILQNQEGTRGTPPPGICAEYGYLLVKKGRKEEGLALLKHEVALYPESSYLIARMIKQLEK